MHDETSPIGTHLAQSDAGDQRARGGDGALDRGRVLGERLAGLWGRLWDRVYRYIDRDPDYDDHTRAIAGDLDGADSDGHAGADAATEANGSGDSDVPGNDRPGPRLLRTYADAHGNSYGVTIDYVACADADVQRRSGEVVSDEGG